MNHRVVVFASVCPDHPLPGFGIVDADGKAVMGRHGIPARWLLPEVAGDVAAALD